MQNYKDKRTLFVKESLRYLLYQTHFFNHKPLGSDFETELPKADEEIITEVCYRMEEYYYPPHEIIYNKGDDMDSIIIVVEGILHVILKSSQN